MLQFLTKQGPLNLELFLSEEHARFLFDLPELLFLLSVIRDHASHQFFACLELGVALWRTLKFIGAIRSVQALVFPELKLSHL